MRLTSALLCAVSVLAMAPLTHAGTLFNNITGSSDVAAGVEGANFYLPESLGAQFSTSNAATLSEVDVLVTGYGAGDTDFNEYLFSDNSGAPGSSLATLATDISAPDSTAVVSTAGLSFALAANTNYWLVLTPVDDSTLVGWDLGGSSSVNELSVYEANPGPSDSNWSGFNGNVQFAIDGTSAVTATPEPSSLILLGTGILGVAAMVRRRLA